jgi:hypothetical protein
MFYRLIRLWIHEINIVANLLWHPTQISASQRTPIPERNSARRTHSPNDIQTRWLSANNGPLSDSGRSRTTHNRYRYYTESTRSGWSPGWFRLLSPPDSVGRKCQWAVKPSWAENRQVGSSGWAASRRRQKVSGDTVSSQINTLSYELVTNGGYWAVPTEYSLCIGHSATYQLLNRMIRRLLNTRRVRSTSFSEDYQYLIYQ